MIDSAVVLAIGKPTHHTELAQQRPRAMLPAIGKPLVVRVMDRLYQAGIRHYIVILGLDEGPVAAYLNRQWLPDAKLTFQISTAGNTLSGLLAEVARELGHPFMVAAYDSFMYDRFVQSLVSLHDEQPDDFIITGTHLTLSPDAHNYYAMVRDDKITAITLDAPTEQHYVLTDHAIMGQHIVDHLAQLPDREARAYGTSLGQIAATYHRHYPERLQVGETSWILRIESDADLLTLNKRLLEDSYDAHILSEVPYTVKIIPPVRIDPQVSIGQGAVLGPYVYIERKASIGYGARVENTIVLGLSNIPADTHVENSIVAASKTIQL